MKNFKIRVKNIRPFGANDQIAEFDIKPLNILIGPNNSGKTTLSKLVKFIYLNILNESFLSTFTVDLQKGFGKDTNFLNLHTIDAKEDFIQLEIEVEDRILLLILKMIEDRIDLAWVYRIQLFINPNFSLDSNKKELAEKNLEIFNITTKLQNDEYVIDILQIFDNEHSDTFLKSKKDTINRILGKELNDSNNSLNNESMTFNLLLALTKMDELKKDIKDANFKATIAGKRSDSFSYIQVGNSVNLLIIEYLQYSLFFDYYNKGFSNKFQNIFTFSGIDSKIADGQIINYLNNTETVKKECEMINESLIDLLNCEFPKYYVNDENLDKVPEINYFENTPYYIEIDFLTSEDPHNIISFNHSSLGMQVSSLYLTQFKVPDKLLNILTLIAFYKNFNKLTFDFDLNGFAAEDLLTLDDKKEKSHLFNLNEFLEEDKWAIYKWDVLSIFYDEEVIEFLHNHNNLHSRIMKELFSLIDFYNTTPGLVLSPYWLLVELQDEWFSEGYIEGLQKVLTWPEFPKSNYPDNENMEWVNDNPLFSHLRYVIESFSNYFLKYLYFLKPKIQIRKEVDDFMLNNKIYYKNIDNEFRLTIKLEKDKSALEKKYIINNYPKYDDFDFKTKYDIRTEIRSSDIVNFGTGLANEFRFKLLLIIAKSSNDSLIILEEPEAHLHPKKISSYAMDLIDFIKSSDVQNRIIFVETHSEHLIRALQVAIKKISIENTSTDISNKLIIDYFSEDNKSASYLKSIKILNNGLLSDEFGTGFFDEASFLIYELYNN